MGNESWCEAVGTLAAKPANPRYTLGEEAGDQEIGPPVLRSRKKDLLFVNKKKQKNFVSLEVHRSMAVVLH